MSSDASHRRPIPWKRLLRDAGVVVASVYVAIVLEGASADREHRREAEQALARLEIELQQDRSDLVEVLAAQRDRLERHERIDRWMGEPSAIPGDSLTADIVALFGVNRTMFPRGSSWATMVSSGQLAYLDDPELVSRLGNLYENLNPRLEYNGQVYDGWVIDIARRDVPSVWNRSAGTLQTSDPIPLAHFRESLLGLLDLARGFVGLLEEWEVELAAVQAEVERHRTDR